MIPLRLIFPLASPIRRFVAHKRAFVVGWPRPIGAFPFQLNASAKPSTYHVACFRVGLVWRYPTECQETVSRLQPGVEIMDRSGNG